MSVQQALVVKTQMLIRRPAAEVFEAFVNPAITTKFWFTKSSGRLEPGREVRWEWEMYNASACVHVQAVEQNRRILIEWDEPPCPVEWLFIPQSDNSTLVSIRTWSFQGSEQEAAEKAVDAMGGFTLVLAGLKGTAGAQCDPEPGAGSLSACQPDRQPLI